MELYLLSPDLQSKNFLFDIFLLLSRIKKKEFSKQNMEMELYLLFPDLQSKIFFYNVFLITSKDCKNGF